MLAKFAAIVLRKDILGTIVPMTMIALGIYNTPKIVMIMLNSTTKKTGATMLKNLIRMNLLNATNVVMMHSGEEVIMNVNNADGVDYLMTIDTHCKSGEDFPRLFLTLANNSIKDIAVCYTPYFFFTFVVLVNLIHRNHILVLRIRF